MSGGLLDDLEPSGKDIMDEPEETLNKMIDICEDYIRKERLEEKLSQILEERLDIVLQKANIPGDTLEERFLIYKEALSISEKGYHAARDADY